MGWGKFLNNAAVKRATFGENRILLSYRIRAMLKPSHERAPD